MSWMDEIPENSVVQVRLGGNFGMVYDPVTGASEFTQGVVNASGDIILIATSNGEPIQVDKTENDDGSANYSYGREPGAEITLKFIFPDETTDKNLNFYPPRRNAEGEIFLETFTDNTFDLPWKNIQPAWLLGEKFCDTKNWGSDHSNDLMDCSFLANNKLIPSFSLSAVPGYIEPYARYFEIPDSGIFGHLWVTISAKIFEGLRTVFVENYNSEYRKEMLSVNRFILGFVRQAKGYDNVVPYTGIGVDLGNLARIFSGEYDNPVLPGIPFHPKEGKPLYDVVKNENSISVRLWPLIGKFHEDSGVYDPVNSGVISLESYETWWNNYQSPVVPLGCANMVKRSETVWYRDYPLFTDMPTHAVLHITNHFNYPSNYGIWKSGFVGHKGVV